MKNKIKTVQFKRKRKGLTNYKKRQQLLISRQCRVIVRKTNKHLILQAATFDPKGDKVLITITTKDLEKQGWKGNTKNTSAAYLIGLIFGKKAKEKGIKKLIPDLGIYTPVKGCKLFAALKGIKDAGAEISLSETVVPSEDRIKGQHLVKWAEKANEKDPNHFKKYAKKTLDIKKLVQHFEEIKNKILK
ncbi:50S ribosomal protein L18 [Candidatus Woesearchaeota archaeon CG10_big_fil_rev_8_21_14_0_10_30_7]|nr:MAG: 50S ribosomal protein L18 [Candidatus Woesearchaeota archaeon CG10_big_fil_rev_8_21_14_0_10_30_7]